MVSYLEGDKQRGIVGNKFRLDHTLHEYCIGRSLKTLPLNIFMSRTIMSPYSSQIDELTTLQEIHKINAILLYIFELKSIVNHMRQN